ncbi:unnamed protein product, partial [Effrenium voratum]
VGHGRGVLAWDGLSSCVERLKAGLEHWTCEERARALERQTDAAQAQQDAAAVASALRKASIEDPWEQGLSALLQNAKAQRENFGRVADLLRKHTKFLKKDSDLTEKIPEEGEPLTPDELQSLVVKFLEQIVDRPKAKEAKEKKKKDVKEKRSKSTEADDADEVEEVEDEEKGKKRKKGKSKAKEKKSKEDKKKRRKKSAKDESCSEDYSYTPSPKRRRKRRRRRRRPSPSYSRSYSYTPSRDKRRRGRRKRRREEKLNVDAEIDRFVRVNKLEERCEKILRDLDSALALKVMGLSGGTNTFELSGDVRDPTAVVLARIRKAQFAKDVNPGPRPDGADPAARADEDARKASEYTEDIAYIIALHSSIA